MTIKEFIDLQLKNIEQNKAVDTARIEGFYQGVLATLRAIPADIVEGNSSVSVTDLKEDQKKKTKTTEK